MLVGPEGDFTPRLSRPQPRLPADHARPHHPSGGDSRDLLPENFPTNCSLYIRQLKPHRVRSSPTPAVYQQKASPAGIN